MVEHWWARRQPLPVKKIYHGRSTYGTYGFSTLPKDFKRHHTLGIWDLYKLGLASEILYNFPLIILLQFFLGAAFWTNILSRPNNADFVLTPRPAWSPAEHEKQLHGSSRWKRCWPWTCCNCHGHGPVVIATTKTYKNQKSEVPRRALAVLMTLWYLMIFVCNRRVCFRRLGWNRSLQSTIGWLQLVGFPGTRYLRYGSCSNRCTGCIPASAMV